MFKQGSEERHPFGTLIFLLVIVMACAIVFSIIAFMIGVMIVGFEPMINMAGGNYSNVNVLRLFQIVSSFGMFVVSAIIFARTQSKNWLNYLKVTKFNFLLAGLTILLMFSSGPFFELINEWNKSMILPGFLRDVEVWMKLKEAQMYEMTLQLLVMETIPVLLINMLMLAIIPALGEELIFRGCLQKVLGRWTGNYHLAIWLTAIIFSSIHFQFYGFLPRMFLGALFGYLLVWSQSLWLPILAHLINNGVAVITAFVLQQQGKPLESMYEPQESPAYAVIASGVTFAALLWYFYSSSLKLKLHPKESTYGSELD